jgi:hypothetical protein
MRTLTAGLLTLALAAPAAAGTLAGVTLPDTAEAGGAKLVLNGLALRERFMVDVYVAGLYLETKSAAADAILAADAPRRMVLHFVHEVDRAALCDGWKEGLAANTPGAPAEVAGQFETLCSWMADVAEGDEVAMTYVPGAGTEVVVQGASRGTIPGKAFADAVLACWIGPKPGPGAKFKKGVLGG